MFVNVCVCVGLCTYTCISSSFYRRPSRVRVQCARRQRQRGHLEVAHRSAQETRPQGRSLLQWRQVWGGVAHERASRRDTPRALHTQHTQPHILNAHTQEHAHNGSQELGPFSVQEHEGRFQVYLYIYIYTSTYRLPPPPPPSRPPYHVPIDRGLQSLGCTWLWFTCR
jgi:hypothetical protein